MLHVGLWRRVTSSGSWLLRWNVIDGTSDQLAAEGYKYCGEERSWIKRNLLQMVTGKKLNMLGHFAGWEIMVWSRSQCLGGRMVNRCMRGMPHREWLDDTTDQCGMKLHQYVWYDGSNPHYLAADCADTNGIMDGWACEWRVIIARWFNIIQRITEKTRCSAIAERPRCRVH